MKKQLLAITLLLSAVELSATTSGLSYFLPRAQNGTAVDVLGWSPEINKYDASGRLLEGPCPEDAAVDGGTCDENDELFKLLHAERFSPEDLGPHEQGN